MAAMCPASGKLAGHFYVCTAGGSCGVIFYLSALCHSHSWVVSGFLPPPDVPALCRRLRSPEIMNEIPLEQIAGFVRGVYFALKRRGLETRQAFRKKLSLVSDLYGQKQGKTEHFMVADLRKMQENQWVSEIWRDKSEFDNGI